jgi:hypothetical protein
VNKDSTDSKDWIDSKDSKSSESTLKRESPAKRGERQTKVWTLNGIYKLPLVSTSGEQKTEIRLQPNSKKPIPNGFSQKILS